MQIDKKADFVLKGGKALHPPVGTDGLEFYYDVKGKKNSDKYKDKLLDMSGQGKDGELSRFDYDGELSGYVGDNGLVFDGLEDTLKMPKLSGIDADNFTYQLNNNILAFTGDEVKTVKNGNVEVGGRNYLRNSDFSLGTEFWSGEGTLVDGGVLLEGVGGSSSLVQNMSVVPEGDYTLQVWYEVLEGQAPYLYNNGGSDARAVTHFPFKVDKEYFEVRITIGASNLMFAFRYAGHSPADHRLGKTLIKRVKLEKGNKAKDWTPAPEDLIETTELKGNILGDMEDIVDASPRDRQSGKEIFTDQADDSHVQIEVDGQSYQRFDPNARNMVPTKYEDWLIDHDYNKDDGALEVRSNRMAASWLIEVESNKSYYYDTGNSDIWYVIRTLDSSKTIENESWGGSGSSGVKTTNSTTKYLGVALYNGISGLIVKDEFQAGNIKPIIQDASVTDRSFIKYVPKAPSPDYPIEIESVNDFDVVSSPVGRNLVIPSDVTPGHAIRSSGAIVSETGPFVTGFIEVKADEFYTISMLLQKNRYSRVAYYDLDKNFIKRDVFRDQEVTQIKPEQDGFIRWSPDVDVSINDYIPGYKIELGTNHSLIDKINLNLDEPLRSVGGVKDRLFKDDNDGLWKVKRKTKEVHMGNQYKATNDYTHTNTPDGLKVYRLSGYLAIRMSENTTHINSSRFTYNPEENQRGTAKLHHVGMNSSSGGLAHYLCFAVSEDDFPTLSSFNDWLVEEENSGTPVTLQVQLRPEDVHTETLDQEQQHQLNTLKSFKDSNYIYTVQNTDNPHKEQLKPTLHATFNSKDYLKETRTLTNLLIWARELSDEELIHHNQLFLNRFNLPSDKVIGEPIEQTLNLLHGGMVGHSLEQNYTINI